MENVSIDKGTFDRDVQRRKSLWTFFIMFSRPRIRCVALILLGGLGWMIKFAMSHKYESKIILAGNDYLSVGLVGNTIFL